MPRVLAEQAAHAACEQAERAERAAAELLTAEGSAAQAQSAAQAKRLRQKQHKKVRPTPYHADHMPGFVLYPVTRAAATVAAIAAQG